MNLPWTTGGPALLAAGWMPPFLVAGLYLAGALLVGAAVVALLNRWRRRAGSEHLTAGDQLAQFRSLYEEGVISQEEFERLRSRLGGQLRHSLGVAPRPGPAGPDERVAASTGKQAEGPPGDERPPEPPANGVRPA